MNEKLYKILKYIFQIIVPAIGTLYGTVSAIWGLPFGEAITATCAAITVFGNAVLMIDSNNFFNDKEIVEKQE